ncbi:LamG domain-containing protein [Vibrio splendidus]|nr:LamG domain-containing protein [Vibrio splendidus]MCC4883106.1 LamG domain-containing protein [Vibrio splendidus]
MKNKLISACVLSILSSSVNADYMMRAPLKKTYNFFPNIEYTYGDWVDIGEIEDCDLWSPLSTTIGFGEGFQQERDCKQQQSRSVQVTHTNPDTGESISGDSYMEYGTLIVKEHQESIGQAVNFSISIPSALEFQNDKVVIATAEIHSAKNIAWETSPNIDASGSGESVSLVAKDENDGWVRYQLTDSAGIQSVWSQKQPVDVVNELVDTRHLIGTKYEARGRSIGVSSRTESNFSYETWVKPNKVVKEGSVQSNLGVDGTSGENYVFSPDHGYDSNNHGVGLSVGTNGIKLHIHSSGYMPAIYVNYTPIPSSQWTHVAVSVTNNVASIYKNGVLIGKALPPSHGVIFSPSYIGDSSSYGAFYGYLAESRVWNKPLSSNEIKDRYLRHIESHGSLTGRVK